MYLPVGQEDDDRGLIERCLAGESAAFEPLVRRYHPALFRVAARLLGSREEARDVTQTAFLKAYQALATCDPERRFFSWIYRIVVNECLNVLRGRRQMEPLADDIPAVLETADPLADDETRRAVRKAIVRLPDAQRDVILLRHFADLSYEQMAAALGIPEKTVKSRLFSARQKLCELLATLKV